MISLATVKTELKYLDSLLPAVDTALHPINKTTANIELFYKTLATIITYPNTFRSYIQVGTYPPQR